MATKTVGDAMNDPTTNLFKVHQTCTAQFEARKAKALAFVASEGCSLEQAFAKVWGV